MTPFKIMAGGAAIFALLFTFAMTRIPASEPASAHQAQFDSSWEDVMQTFPVAKKADRFISTGPKPVAVERILPDAPAEEPVVDASRGLRRTRSPTHMSSITNRPDQELRQRHHGDAGGKAQADGGSARPSGR